MCLGQCPRGPAYRSDVGLHTKLYVWMVLLFFKMGSVSWSPSDNRLQEGKSIICNVPKKMGTQEELMETSVQEVVSREKQEVEVLRWKGSKSKVHVGWL